MTLRAPALANVWGFGGCHVGGKFANALGGNLGDGSRPFRGFLYLVVTGAHNVILVGLVLTLGGIGHGVIVEANDISIEKLFVNLIVNNPLMG